MMIIAALYHFARFPDPVASAPAGCQAGGVKGSLFPLAPEGINGTIAGPREGIDNVLAAFVLCRDAGGWDGSRPKPTKCHLAT